MLQCIHELKHGAQWIKSNWLLFSDGLTSVDCDRLYLWRKILGIVMF